MVFSQKLNYQESNFSVYRKMLCRAGDIQPLFVDRALLYTLEFLCVIDVLSPSMVSMITELRSRDNKECSYSMAGHILVCSNVPRDNL